MSKYYKATACEVTHQNALCPQLGPSQLLYQFTHTCVRCGLWGKQLSSSVSTPLRLLGSLTPLPYMQCVLAGQGNRQTQEILQNGGGEPSCPIQALLILLS